MVTTIAPLAPDPSTAVMVLLSNTINDATFTPPTVTEVAWLKLEPMIVIVCPTPATIGVTFKINGLPHLLCKIDMLLETKLDVTISGLLSPLKSPIAKA